MLAERQQEANVVLKMERYRLIYTDVNAKANLSRLVLSCVLHVHRRRCCQFLQEEADMYMNPYDSPSSLISLSPLWYAECFPANARASWPVIL